MTFFSKKNTLMTLLFLVAFTLSAWSILLSRQPSSKNHDHSDEPDARMENVIALVMNKQGAPSLKVEAPVMTHYAEDDVTWIDHPHVTVYRQSPAPWTIHSNHAEASNGTEEIIFSDHVVIHHPTDVANPDTVMETTTLTVFPDKKQASTDQPVVITQPDTVIHAVGMVANLNDGTVKLLSEARGDYVPAS